MSVLKGWKRGDLAVYQGGIPTSVAELTEGDTYVVNAAGGALAHDGVYLKIVTDDERVVDLLHEHFHRVRNGGT